MKTIYSTLLQGLLSSFVFAGVTLYRIVSCVYLLHSLPSVRVFKVTLGVNEEGQLWEESRTHSGRTCSLPFHPETTGGFNQNEE